LWIWRATHIKKAARRELKRAQEVQRYTGVRVFECGTFVAKGDKKKLHKKIKALKTTSFNYQKKINLNIFTICRTTFC